jgi:hypothetical protein
MKKPKKKNDKKKKGLFDGQLIATYDPSLDNIDFGPAIRRCLEEANRILRETGLV